MAEITSDQLRLAILSEPCLHNARHHGDCLTVACWVNAEYRPAAPVLMTPEAVAELMGWPLKLGMVHPK